MSSRTWVARARAVVDEVRTLMRPFGVTIDPEVRVVAEPHPIPGYVHDERLISFCPPVIERSTDRLRWLYFGRHMGCASIEEAVAFYEVGLPFVIAHELAHHVRFSRELASDSPFVEEQVCDVIATAWIEALPRYRATLVPLRQRCRSMRQAIERGLDQPQTPFLPDLGAAMAHSSELAPEIAARLRTLSADTGVPVAELLSAHPAAESGAFTRAVFRETRVRSRLESRYTDDPGEYWYLSLTWVESYLGISRPGSLADVVREHLMPDDAGRPEREVAAALRQVMVAPRAGLPPLQAEPSTVAGLRGAAACGLLSALGPDAVAEVVETLTSASDPQTRLALARALRSHWPEQAVAPAHLWAEPLSSRPDPALALALVRIAARAGVALPREPWQRWWTLVADQRDVPPTLPAELMAASVLEPDPVTLAAALDRPEGPEVVDAWRQHHGGLEGLPVAGRRLWGRVSPPSRRALALVLPLAELLESLPPRGAHTWTDTITAVRNRLSDGIAWPPVERNHLWAAAARRDLGRGAKDLEAQTARRLAVGSTWLRRAAELPEDDVAQLAAMQLHIDARRLATDLVRSWAKTDRLATLHRLLERESWSGSSHPDVDAIVAAALPARLREPVNALLRGHASGMAVASFDHELLPPVVRVGLGLEEDPVMLSIAERVVQLRRTPLFANIEPTRLWEVAERCVERSLAPGELLFAEGETGDELFLVIAGEIDVERGDGKGGARAVAAVGAGAVLGEMAVFEASPRSAGARARHECRVLGLGADALARVGREHPEVYEALLRALSSRLRETTDRLVGT